jgi:hypothetical protein
MLDQIVAIDNTRFIEKIADLPLNLQSELNQKKFDVLN